MNKETLEYVMEVEELGKRLEVKDYEILEKTLYLFDECAKELFEKEERINKALHRIQLLQMDGEVTIRDLGLILRDLKGEDK